MGQNKKPIANKLKSYICRYDDSTSIFKFDNNIKLCKLIYYLKSDCFKFGSDHYLQS